MTLYHITIIDDNPQNLNVLSQMLLKQGFKVTAFPQGALALKAIEKQPPDLILLDITMPGMSGYEVCSNLKQDDRLKDIPIIFISALHDTESKVKAFNFGGVDYITKPFQFEEVQARVRTHLNLRHMRLEIEDYSLRLEELVAEQVKEIADSQLSVIFALAKLAESRDKETGGHIERVQKYCKTLAQVLAADDTFSETITPAFINTIFHASPLHDIGKVGIEDAILLKPGKLTVEEFDQMKTHTLIGARTLDSVHRGYPKNELVKMGIDIAQYHHEKWDGTGYPEGLSGQGIPLSARIMAFADVYDALRSRRPYKEPFSHEKACRIISKGLGSHFDPQIGNAFLKIEQEFEKIHHLLSDEALPGKLRDIKIA